MSKQQKDFLILFLTQVLMYTILCINYRAVAKGDYLQSAVSDFMIASASFFVIKRIAKEEKEGDNAFWPWLGYALGGVVGSILGIWISKILLNG